MTAEEVFCDLYDKYGKDFSWHMIPLSQSNGALVEELKKKIGNNHFLYNKKIPEEYALRNGENKWKKDDVIRDFVNSASKQDL